jgi:uncharacterized membrane protein YfcA
MLAGPLGLGGGFVLVLFWTLYLTQVPEEISMRTAVATSLMTIIFTSSSSAWSHHARGSLDAFLIERWAAEILIGASCGGLVAKFINACVLKSIFGAIALLISVNLVRKVRTIWRDDLPAGSARLALHGFVCASGRRCLPQYLRRLGPALFRDLSRDCLRVNAL